MCDCVYEREIGNQGKEKDRERGRGRETKKEKRQRQWERMCKRKGEIYSRRKRDSVCIKACERKREEETVPDLKLIFKSVTHNNF